MKIENQPVNFYFSLFNLKKMKIEPRFSFFIFQLSEKMNDPNIHALYLHVSTVFITKQKSLGWSKTSKRQRTFEFV